MDNDYYLKLSEKERVLAVIPAPIGMAEVSAINDEEDAVDHLGYEYPGKELNWTEIARKVIERRRYDEETEAKKKEAQ